MGRPTEVCHYSLEHNFTIRINNYFLLGGKMLLHHSSILSLTLTLGSIPITCQTGELFSFQL